MFLHRIHLDPRCREARRDLADPYQLHSTLCRAFSAPEEKCPKGAFLWRLEPETDPSGYPRLLVQSQEKANWERVAVKGWLAQSEPAIDLSQRLKLDALKAGQRFRFRLCANPCVKRDGKRQGLMQLEEQEAWLVRKGKQHGFSLPRLESFDLTESPTERVDVRVSQEQILRGTQHDGNGIRIFSVLYDGMLIVTNAEKFKIVLHTGIGHGKVMGLGLLSVVSVM